MKQRVHTWLTIVAGALALPLLAACGLALTPAWLASVLSIDTFTAEGDGALHASTVPQQAALERAALEETALMSCADPVGLTTVPDTSSPLWCEDTESGPRCAPASPTRPAHDFSDASPVLVTSLPAYTAPVFTLSPAARTYPRSNDTHVSRLHAVRLERPPRA